LDLCPRDDLQESELEARRHGSGKLSEALRDEGPRFEAVSFSDIEGWHQDDHAAALRALLRSCVVGDRPIASVCAAARALDKEAGGAVSPAAARALFEAHFTPHAIAGGEPGLVTGYYEPELRGSRARGARFNIPVYGRPDDLVQITPDVERARFNDKLSCMRQTEKGLVPYYTRAEIEADALEGRGLELLYLDDPVELFFMQVQGSGLVLLAEGGAVRLSYAGKNGHAYTSIGARLVERGAFRGGAASMQGVKAWLRADLARGRGLMVENASYVFFRELSAEEGSDGPLGPHGVPLTPGRSLAVDGAIHALGTPIFVAAPGLRASDGRPFRRLMIAQDVGSAIRGAERGDIFFGSGERAGAIAGTTRETAQFFVLLPKR
jgi:peptidoglycan lytic transglycosylase A